jgi:hypothetical protein
MKRLLSFSAAVLLGGCVVAAPKPKMSADEAFSPPPPDGPVSRAQSRAALGPPKDWARQYRRDLECERAAHELVPAHGAEVAWTYLKACIEKGNFTQLKTLVENWEDDLKTRPEAPSIIAQIIASRGGHLRPDLEILQQRRIPVFDLASALKQSAAFTGRYLVFVGKIAEAKTSKGKIELVLAEQTLTSEVASVLSGPRTGAVSTSSGSGQVGFRSNGIVGSGSAQGSYTNRSTTESGRIEQRVTDTFEDTGQEVIAKIKQPDPFLTADKSLVFLVRFDGALVTDTEAASEGEEPYRTALVTLISYHDL